MTFARRTPRVVAEVIVLRHRDKHAGRRRRSPRRRRRRGRAMRASRRQPTVTNILAHGRETGPRGGRPGTHAGESRGGADRQCRGGAAGRTGHDRRFRFPLSTHAKEPREAQGLADRLRATVLRPYYPASGLFRVTRDDDGLQVDFMTSIHGVKSFEGVRDRATRMDIDGTAILVASLDDVIRSKKAARRPGISPSSKFWRGHVKRKPAKPAKRRRDALARENERADRRDDRRWQALPPERRTHFLRKRIGVGRSAL